MMPAVGLEPTRSCLQQILSLPRLPFRHTGKARGLQFIPDEQSFKNAITISYLT